MLRSTLIGSIGMITALTIGAAGGAQWSITDNPKGAGKQMSLDNPATALKIEDRITVQVDKNGNVTGGHVRFTNGVERDMEQKESANYFELFDGNHALWDFLESHGQLVTLKPNDKIPMDWYGNQVRMVYGSGHEVVGTLTRGTDAEQSAIKVEGACCGLIYFSMSAVTKLQTFANQL